MSVNSRQFCLSGSLFLLTGPEMLHTRGTGHRPSCCS